MSSPWFRRRKRRRNQQDHLAPDAAGHHPCRGGPTHSLPRQQHWYATIHFHGSGSLYMGYLQVNSSMAPSPTWKAYRRLPPTPTVSTCSAEAMTDRCDCGTWRPRFAYRYATDDKTNSHAYPVHSGDRSAPQEARCVGALGGLPPVATVDRLRRCGRPREGVHLGAFTVRGWQSFRRVVPPPPEKFECVTVLTVYSTTRSFLVCLCETIILFEWSLVTFPVSPHMGY